jgi:hypothetical protein
MVPDFPGAPKPYPLSLGEDVMVEAVAAVLNILARKVRIILETAQRAIC